MMGELNTPGLRHRRRAAGAARHRRRGGLPPPLRRSSRRGCDGAGVQVARLQSLLDALQVFLPGLFVVVVVWLGARFAVEGQISPGELVAFYGYSAFLMIPLRTGTEVVEQADPRARRRPADLPRPLGRAGGSGHRRAAVGVHATSDLVDVQSGLRVRPGPTDRRRRGGARRVGGARRPDRPLRRGTGPARRRLAVGSRADVRPPRDRGQRRQRDAVQRTAARRARRARRRRPTTTSWPAIATASAEDVIDALDDGLDTEVEERGRSFSGGQRQRLVLTRALRRRPRHPGAGRADVRRRRAHRGAHRRAAARPPAPAARPWSPPRARCCSTRPTRWRCSRTARSSRSARHRELLDDPRYRRIVARGEDE